MTWIPLGVAAPALSGLAQLLQLAPRSRPIGSTPPKARGAGASPRPPNVSAPRAFSARDVSLIMPVKDNEAGVCRFLHRLWGATLLEHYTGLPKELIIVDNNSARPIRLPLIAHAFNEVMTVRLIRCATPGPAAARNAGVATATRPWLQFIDSDCLPRRGFVSGFGFAVDGSVGYAGAVRAFGKDALSRYYETQRILEPPPDEHGRPRYLVTANALVWREAFERIGGFREDFKLAAGEDVDLALRLRDIGRLAYAPKAVVAHDFEPNLISFWNRFVRYGVGNRQVEHLHGLDLAPRPFLPNRETTFNWLAASAQYLAMTKGYGSSEE